MLKFQAADELYHRYGVRVSEATVRRALRAQGVVGQISAEIVDIFPR
jgi:hypothetical protein